MNLTLNVPRRAEPPLKLELAMGDALFILGANGSGKSSLVHYFFRAHSANARRLSAHRQTWFRSGSVSITGNQRRATENSIRNWDVGANSRWIEHGADERANVAVYDLVDAQNVRARAIAAAADDERFDLVRELRKVDAPLKVLNEILRSSGIPIVVSLGSNDELLASKLDSKSYSIAELSDGERNVLLIASNVLTAKPGTLLLIDEPERHIHRSISSRLLTLLFARRPDCAFVVSTHDVTLPVDNPGSRIILLRSCSFNGEIAWEADLLDTPLDLDERLVGEILGARRRILFVEGTNRSLDCSFYSLLFPDVSVVAKSSCRDVEHTVTGIRGAENLHWVRAFGIVDADGRGRDDLAVLKRNGVYPLDAFSVESIYYHPELQSRVAGRQSVVTGDDVTTKLNAAKQAALTKIASHKERLSARVVEKSLRDVVLGSLPKLEDVTSGKAIAINLDVAAALANEVNRLESALNAGDLEALVVRYPVRETGALREIAVQLGFQNQHQYEKAVRALLVADEEAMAFVRSLFGDLCADLA